MSAATNSIVESQVGKGASKRGHPDDETPQEQPQKSQGSFGIGNFLNKITGNEVGKETETERPKEWVKDGKIHKYLYKEPSDPHMREEALFSIKGTVKAAFLNGDSQ
jgi:hypothetical protein